jgi:hypothetical protein
LCGSERPPAPGALCCGQRSPTRYSDRAEFFQQIHPADVVINLRACSLFDDEALAHAPRLRLISILGAWTDNMASE